MKTKTKTKVQNKQKFDEHFEQIDFHNFNWSQHIERVKLLRKQTNNEEK